MAHPRRRGNTGIGANRIQIRRRRSPTNAWIALVLQEIVIRRCAGDSRQALKSPILRTKIVERTGHYLNSKSDLASGVLELIRTDRERLASI